MQAYLIDIFDSSRAKGELVKVGVSATGRLIMEDKLKFVVIKLKNINSTALNILKQEALRIGAELANHRDVITGRIPKSDSLLFGTPVQVRFIIQKIKNQEFGLKGLAKELDEILSFSDKTRKKSNPLSIKAGGKKLVFDGNTLIMGVLNITPDSFSDGGKYLDKKAAEKRGREIEEEGAHILDIGGESTRPGAALVDAKEEIKRICPVMERLARTLKIPISVDTRKPEVALAAINSGASIINDASGLSFDPDGMAKVLLKTKSPYILAHSRGKTPDTMQKNLVPYDDIFYEIIEYFQDKIKFLAAMGYRRENIILDPGFGFAKSFEDNYNLLIGTPSFKSLGSPVLAGVSRKSFINKLTGKTEEVLLSGDIAAAVVLKLNRVDMVRVHDVRATASAFTVIDNIYRKGE